MKKIRHTCSLILFLLIASFACAGSIDPARVAVVFNQSLPESVELARSYQKARSIPEKNMIGLDLPDREEITRAEYVSMLEKPLRDLFEKNRWWKRGRTSEGVIVASENQIEVMVTMRGVPLKISRLAKEASPESKTQKDPAATPANPVQDANEAAVDSELAILSYDGHLLEGPIKNPYFESKSSFTDAQLPYIMLVGRIDGPSFAICQRMISDAKQAERTGLWGRAYVDIAQFYPEGDSWLRSVAAQTSDAGIPVEVHGWKEVFPKNYPLRDVSTYFGWYEWNVCGPFVKPGFTFKTGAVAVHLHSFSAATLRSETTNWCGPLLARGAAVTLGNVYEPYLSMTHNFDKFQKNLLEGATVVEAAYAAIPVLSWQGIVLGDPLYRPYLHLDATGEKVALDRPYRALRVAKMLNTESDSKYLAEIERVGRTKSNSIFLESLGLIHLMRKQEAKALQFIREAKAFYPEPADRLRCEMHVIGVDRDAGRIEMAIRALRLAETTYAGIPEIESVRSMLALLDPPPPPPVPVGQKAPLPKK
jgi:uncharacterized protein (TIGR03790 family)